MNTDEQKKANAQLQEAGSIGAILDSDHGAAILANPKELASFEAQAKHIGENLLETSKKYAALKK